MTEGNGDATYAQRVGVRLRMVRKQKGLSLQEVEAISNQEFKASVLGAYERGERAISVPRLQRLARVYGVPVDRLLPEEQGAVIDLAGEEEARAATRPPEEAITLDLSRLQQAKDPDLEVVSRYATMIQLQRQDFNGRVLTIRRDDVRALACLFGTTPEGLRRKLDELGVRAVT